MTPVGQALSDLNQAKKLANNAPPGTGRRESAEKIVREKEARLDRAVDESIADIKKAGYQVTVSGKR